VSLLILVVDDEPDVEALFQQRFRRDLRAGRFVMEFAQSGPAALQRIGDAEGVSLILILSRRPISKVLGFKPRTRRGPEALRRAR
jgi:CheY-like chemotaxis protein